MADLETLARQWIAAFHDHDEEALMACYHDNARHFSPIIEKRDPESKGWIQGKDKMRQHWGPYLASDSTLDYEFMRIMTGTSENGLSEMVMVYKRLCPPEPEKIVMEYYLIKDDLIVESRVLRSWAI